MESTRKSRAESGSRATHRQSPANRSDAESSGSEPQPAWRSSKAALRIGVSACLLGRQVRFDGGHKRNPMLLDLLGPWVEWVPVCPEVEVGLGVPRPTLRLARSAPDEPVRLVRPSDETDLTRRMQVFAARRSRQLSGEQLCGFVLKKDSPSCGMERVKVYAPRGAPRRDGVGLFAAALAERYPILPIEEEGRLCDLELRENFIERVFGYWRLQVLFGERWSMRALVEFHTAHKLQLMAHSPQGLRLLGQEVANPKGRSRSELRTSYSDGFMKILRLPATRARHVNVLQHMIGYLRRGLHASARDELADLIEEFRAGIVPLIVPLTLFRHHIRELGIDYLEGQMYLEPHPRELMLRNHA